MKIISAPQISADSDWNGQTSWLQRKGSKHSDKDFVLGSEVVRSREGGDPGMEGPDSQRGIEAEREEIGGEGAREQGARIRSGS